MINLHGVEVDLTPKREELMKGGWESGRIRSILANIKQGNVLIDVGAEQGDMSALFAKAGAEVACIEPSPIMWAHIKSNFDRNGKKPLACYAGFASDKNDENPKDLNYDDTLTDGYPKIAHAEPQDVRSFRHLNEEASATRQITIDTFCKRYKIKPDILHIDVEGAEWNVIKGAEHIIDTCMPIVYMSVHDNLLWLRYEKWFHDIWWEFMRPFGYKVQFLGHDHESHYVFYKKSLIQVNEIL